MPRLSTKVFAIVALCHIGEQTWASDPQPKYGIGGYGTDTAPTDDRSEGYNAATFWCFESVN